MHCLLKLVPNYLFTHLGEDLVTAQMLEVQPSSSSLDQRRSCEEFQLSVCLMRYLVGLFGLQQQVANQACGSYPEVNPP